MSTSSAAACGARASTAAPRLRANPRHEGRKKHGGTDDDEHELRRRPGYQSERRGERHDDEGKLTPLAEQQPHLERLSPCETEEPCEGCDEHGLDGEQPHYRQRYPQRIGENLGQIDDHAHRHEEEPEQEPLEGLDIHFDLMAKLGIGKHQTGEEGAQRCGESGRMGRRRRRDDDQQSHGHEQLRAAKTAHVAEQRPHHQAPDTEDEGDCEHRLDDSEREGSE